MNYRQNGRPYPNNQGYDNGQNNRGNYAPQGRNGGNNRPGKYEPGKATLRPNNEKRGPRDPDYKGVVTIEAPGVYFISGWINRYDDGNEAIGLRMNPADAAQGQGRPQGGGYGRSQQGGGYQQQGYQQQPQQPPQRPQGGAMSRARPIPPQQYQQDGGYDPVPPPTSYPENADGYDVNYPDDVIPF